MRPLQCISTGELSSFRKPNSLCHSASVILLHIVYIYPDLHICSYRAAVDEGHRSLTHRALLLSDYLLTVPPVFHVHCKKKYVLREILNSHAPAIISLPRPIHNSITQIYSLTWFWWMNGKSNISSRSVQARMGCVSHSPFSPIVFFLFRPTMTAKGEIKPE